MAASDYVPTFFKKPLALGGASTDEYIWIFRPRLADCCAIPSFDHYTCDDLRSAGLTPWLRPELCNFPALQVAPR